MEKYDGPEAGTPSLEDPWHDAPGAGWGEWEPQPWQVPAQRTPANGAGAHDGSADTPEDAAADLYLAVQQSPEFQQVRSQYRRFVVPATVAFLGWYLAYIITATVQPRLMAHPVAGVVTVAMLAG
ncbi:MAG: DUF485 domain-containing protein, partial [Kitasatospora sp.]|nr:DUF485 domain-containing protein [Kitasatospora sp.]